MVKKLFVSYKNYIIMGLWNETRFFNTMEVKYCYCFSNSLMPYLPDGFASNLKSMSLTSFVFFLGLIQKWDIADV